MQQIIINLVYPATMKEKIKHIAATLMMLIFLTYVVGVEVSHHTCGKSGAETIKLYGKAECACNHEAEQKGEQNEETCPCQAAAKSTHSHSIETPAVSDDCCVETSVYISIEDAYQVLQIEKINYSAIVSYTVPNIIKIQKSENLNLKINNLACDESNQLRRSIIKFLLNNSNLRAGDDSSISLV